MYRTTMRSSLSVALGVALLSSSTWACHESFFAEAYAPSTQQQVQPSYSGGDDALLLIMHNRGCDTSSEQALMCCLGLAAKALAVAKTMSPRGSGEPCPFTVSSASTLLAMR